MNNLSQIRNLQDIDRMRKVLRKKARKQGAVVEKDIAHIQHSWEHFVGGFTRVKNIFSVFLPRMEYLTVLFPVLKRFIKRK